MPPKKKAPAKKSASSGGLKVSNGKRSTIRTKNKGKGTATTSTKKDDGAKDDTAVGFPQFSRFPVEIQQEIFTQALRKPSIHYIVVKRAVVPGYTNDDGNWIDSTWHLVFYPRAKSRDPSGSRMNKKIAAVNRVAQQAVELAMKKPGELPFAKKWNPIDVNNDLVVFDFIPGATKNEESNFRYFHVDNQFLAPYFDPAASYPEGKSKIVRDNTIVSSNPSGLADIKRVGLIYKQNGDRACSNRNTVFQCCIHVEGSIRPHSDWIMCPDEVAGFIDSVPSIEELYFLVQPQKNKKEEEERLQLYKKWFFTTYHEQLRIHGKTEKWLAMFHDADKTYIEVDRFLMLHSGETRRMDLDIVREVRELINEIHSQLRQDGPHIPKDNRRVFRTSYKKRQAMVYKILLPVSI